MSVLLGPVAYYALLAAGLALCLYLFVSAKRDLRAAERRIGKQQAETEERIRKAQQEIAELRGALQEAEERAGMLVPPQAPRSGLNLSRRSQVLRMHRRGDRPEYIAATLGVPLGEVELLVKVHRMILDLPAGGPKE